MVEATYRRTEPPLVRLNSAGLRFVLSFLEGSSLHNLSVLVPDGLAAGQHFEAVDLLCIAVEVLSLDFGQ